MALANGGFVVTWESFGRNSGWPSLIPGVSIYGQRYDENGDPVGSEFSINTSMVYRRNSSVAALENGGFVVTWDSSYFGDSATSVYGQRYNENGDPVGSEFRINTYTDDRQELSSVAGLENGGFVVTWQSWGQDGESFGVYGQRYDSDGNPVDSEFRVSNTDDDQSKPSVTSLSDGGFLVTWNSLNQDGSRSSVHGQRYDSNGNSVGSEFQINTQTNGNQSLPSVTGLANGSFIVTWQFTENDDDTSNVYGQLFRTDGTVYTDENEHPNYIPVEHNNPTVPTPVAGPAAF